jgi:hypothetical protein
LVGVSGQTKFSFEGYLKDIRFADSGNGLSVPQDSRHFSRLAPWRTMDFMFFRRERPKNLTFQERLSQLTGLGFTVTPRNGGVRVIRGTCAVDLADPEGAVHIAERAGIRMGEEIGRLVDEGFQKFFRTSSGRTKPALAEELKALHDFEEDLKQGLGQQSFYNESLGTVSTFYLYDRLKDRDRGVPKRVWDN